MRIEQKSFFVGDIQQNQNKNENKGAIFSGNKNKALTPIEEKQQEAKKQAKKIVDKAVSVEKALDEDLDNRAKNITQLRESMDVILKDINEVDETREKIKKDYNVLGDSKEQQDLELLEKEIASKGIDSDVELTQEEQEKILEIKKAGLTEYQERMLSSYEGKERLQNGLKIVDKEVELEIATIKAIKLERLKMHTVVDASKAAKEVLKSSSKEIQGIIMEDTKENIEDKMEEIKEEAAKKAEDGKEQEEKIEALKEKLARMEELAQKQSESGNSASIATPLKEVAGVMVEIDSKNNDIKQEVDDIMKKMNLLADDIKGSMVDLKK